jgi:LacI family transcriptional regulator
VRLRTGKTNVISLVMSIETELLGVTSHIVYGISEHLAGTPYHLIVTPYLLGSDPLDPVRYVVETGSADGIIFSRTEPQDPRARYLHEHGFPFVSHGRTELDFAHPFYDFDNVRYAEIAVDRLAARGRRRLALLAPPMNFTYARHMTEGFLRGIARHDLIDVPIRTVDIDSSDAEIGAEITRMMSGSRPPDGLICGSAASAISAIAGAEAAGKRIGRDFDVATKASFDLMRKFRPEIEVIHENFRSAGMELARAVLGAIDGEPASALQILDVPEG